MLMILKQGETLADQLVAVPTYIYVWSLIHNLVYSFCYNPNLLIKTNPEYKDT